MHEPWEYSFDDQGWQNVRQEDHLARGRKQAHIVTTLPHGSAALQQLEVANPCILSFGNHILTSTGV